MPNKRAKPVRYVQPYRYPSPNIPLTAIRRFARRIAERFHPEKIILFGSYAYGTPHEESDVDLLVIMPAYDVVNQAIRICCAFEYPFSLDLIVRTPKQIETGLKQDNWFLREIIEKGKIIYEARNRPVASLRRGGLRSSARPGSQEASPAKYRVLSLPTGRGKVSQGVAARTRRGGAANPRPK
jgi:predicted nucleotidyltransferase